jgi:hypothetical protein
MMAEARKMMDSPEFKKQMKQFEKSKEFKEATKKTKEMMDDPQTAARMAAQAEHMVRTEYTTILPILCFLQVGSLCIKSHFQSYFSLFYRYNVDKIP